MAECKICGKIMSEEAFVINNGMCDICLRTVEGDDDPILETPQIDIKPSSNDINEKFKAYEEKLRKEREFDAKNFEGKAIDEFKFPNFIWNEIRYSETGFSDKSLLLCSRGKMDTIEIVLAVIGMLFLSPFIIVGIGLIVMLIYANFFGTVGGLTGIVGANIFVIFFTIIWNAFIWGMIWNVGMHKIWGKAWINIKEGEIECCTGRKFKPSKVKKFLISNVKAFYIEKDSGKRTVYEVYITPDEKDAINSKQAFKFELEYKYAAEYWQDFLKWYIRSKRRH